MQPTAADKRRAAEILKELEKTYPDADCELDFTTPLELAIGAILSAQCTDVRVNKVTPGLFKKYTCAEDWADASQETLEDEIRSTGFFRNKAKNIIALCKTLVEEYDGALPQDLETLITLPGIGRKTANVLLISAFNQPGITVDTHCKRLSLRLELTDQEDPNKIEFDLKNILPKEKWARFSHCIIHHGRRCCYARKPDCSSCSISMLCPSYDKC